MGENDTIILPGLEGFVYRGPTYLELKQKLKSNPIIYNLIQQNIAKANNPTKEIVTYKDANGNRLSITNVSAGVLSPVDPVGEFYVAGEVLGPAFKLAGRAGEYGLAKTGNNWARARILSRNINNLLLNNKTSAFSAPIVRTKYGDIEIDNPELYYHLSGAGKALNFVRTGRMRTPTEEYWMKQEHVPIRLRTGIVPGFPQSSGRAMFSQGDLWYGLSPKQYPDLLVTAEPMGFANSKGGYVSHTASLKKLESVGKRRVTSANIGGMDSHTPNNTSAYTWVPGYGYKKIELTSPKTSLAFFERPLSRISLAERMGIPKRERNNIIYSPIRYDKKGNLYTHKDYFYRKGWGIIDDALKTKVIRVPKGDYKSWVLKKYPFLNDGFSTIQLNHKFPYFSESRLWPDKYGKAEDIIVVPSKGVDWAGGSKFGSLLKDKKPFEVGGRGTPLINGNINKFPTSLSMLYKLNPTTKLYEPVIGKMKILENPDDNWNLWEPDYNKYLKNIMNEAIKKFNMKKQGGKMNILQFLKNGSGIHIKKENRGKFTDYCGGKVTSECIAKGKRSSNPTIRKRATFADNARHFKHRLGGSIVEAFKLRRLILSSLNNMIND